ncbi:hypothetical protein BJX70DRAFT_143133 [Aspergillus crustosus]
MPFDEHGIKWSCEPCIRGHRSSKCAHFDRLMVSVGKAGRPLSKCPHVQGSCNCKKLCAFMVAIPKAGTGCLCRPVYKMLLDENGPTPPVSQLPIDITAGSSATTSATPSPSKIQKSSKKTVKPALEQVTRTLHSIPELHQQALRHEIPAPSPYTPQAQTGYSYHPTGAIPLQPSAWTPANSYSSGGARLSNGTTTAGTHHVNHFQSPSHTIASTPVHSPGSCCSNSRRDSQSIVKVEPNSIIEDVFSSPSITASPATSSSSHWQGYSSIDGHIPSLDGGANDFHPALAGLSYQVPFNPYSNHADLGFHQIPIPQQYPVGHGPVGPVGPPVAAQHGFTAHTSGTAHNCSCGPKCNCYACPDHPYNDVTVQHVQEIGRIIAEESQTPENENQPQAESHKTNTNEPLISEPLVNSSVHLTNGYDPMPAGSCCGNAEEDEVDDEHDGDTLSPFTGSNVMLPDAYYTYEYQIGLPGACAGEAGDCQCGPSCTCLGCLTHGNE